jgi:carbamate kinase
MPDAQPTSRRRARGAGGHPGRARPLALVAFGGNALLAPGDHGTVAEQRARAEAAAGWLVGLVAAGHDLVIVHGNGPQVGQVLIQMEEAATKLPPGTLDVAVAQTEGSIGYLLELALRDELRRRQVPRECSTVLSLVVVDRDDPGFSEPTKPIGPFFSSWRAAALQREQGWRMVEDAGRGWRKVVASPRPLEILGVGAVAALVRAGHVVIAGGGGGIPVVREPGGSLTGVEAVIDKDRTASLLARELRVDLFVILTGVPHLMRNFGRRNALAVPVLSIRRARQMLAAGHFPAGSMGPKVEAAIDFVADCGRPVLITDVETLPRAVAGEAGTRIVPRL